MALSDKNLVSIEASEHIGPEETGDDVAAKRVVPYNWDGAGWVRPRTTLFKKPYDSLVVNYTDSTKENVSTIVTKLGGVTQQTLTVTYPSDTEEDYVIS